MTKGDLKNKIDDCLISSIINIAKDPTIVSKTDQLQGLIFYHITGECWDSCNDNENL